MGCFFVLYLLNRPAIPPFGKIIMMDKTKEVLANAAIELNLQAQLEAHQLQFKQDCRRTAMNLAERVINKSGGDIISEASKIYNWLIDVK